MKIIFTIGDCNGIGLEVLYKGLLDFLQSNNKNLKFDFTIAGNLKTISEYWKTMNYTFQIDKDNLKLNNKIIKVIDSGEYVKIQFGKEKINAGLLAAKSIEYALDETKKGKYDAMVTMPVSKSVLYKAGWEYPGHTEMLAKNCKIKNPLMILLKDELRVGLVTIHIPFKEVSQRISKKLIML